MKRRTMAILAGVGVAAGLTLTGCASMGEEWNDAPVDHKVDTKAVLFSMPDGFANYAEKCDESGNLVLTTKTDSGRALAIVHAPDICPKSGAPLKLSEVNR